MCPSLRQISIKKIVSYFTGVGHYFFRVIVSTRVITVHIIITKVNKSLYVTIGTNPFHHVRRLDSPQSALLASILYSFKFLWVLKLTSSGCLNKSNMRNSK